ncbi:hypothetical protein ACFQMA_10335 [Halosimplex aquaticum]|uniref:Uncharacterized protein n=1 Tax=Halosimplex aquaticum TaxID=3026162 RepID=A0ABD5XYH5_9EURY|nr:hypothetical protein [Halosimplex aquaticum]
MKRRTLLRGLSAAGALTVTGCLSDGSGGQPTTTDEPTDTDSPTPTDDAGGDTDTDTDTTAPADTQTDNPGDTVTEPDPDGSDTPSDAPTDTVSETPDSEPSATPSGVADKSFSVTGSGCGGQTDDASVSFDESGGTVTVTGTIWGNDACYTAVLSDVRLDGGALTVVVAAESDAGTDTACAECITEINYEATVALDAALPETVTVVHEHGGEDTRVTSASR